MRFVGGSAVVAALAAAAVAGGHAWLNSEPSLSRLRGEVERSLRQRAAGARLDGAVSVDWMGRVVLGPVTIPASRADRPPVLRVETVVVRPSWLALLRGRAVVSSVDLRQGRIEAGPRGEELVRLAERLRGSRRTPAPLTPPDAAPEVSVHGLTLVWSGAGTGARPIVLGPLDAWISPSRWKDGMHLDAAVNLPGGTRGRLRLEPRDGAAALHATLEDLSPRAFPAGITERLPFLVEGGRATLLLEVEKPSALAAGVAKLQLELDELVVSGSRLSPDPIGPVRLAVHGRFRWDWHARRFSLEEAELAVGERGKARADIAADLALRREPRFAVSARVNRLDYAASLAGLPVALVPPSDAPSLDGPFSASFAFAGPLHRPAGWELAASLDLAGLKRAARAADPPFLAGTFEYQPAGSDRAIRIGPENPGFVRISGLPQYVVRAVTTSEDAGFFAHQGFDFVELRNAIVEGAEARRVVRGGSTISQQLAKNLFLSGERTVARKVREALLTVALEASLGKERLLEIYLNIVEWGPRIYGLGEAAHHYFDKDARALTPREAAFLATIIPNPIRYHMYYDRGALTETWNARVNELLIKLRDAGQLTDEQLAAALAEQLVFHEARRPPVPARKTAGAQKQS